MNFISVCIFNAAKETKFQAANASDEKRKEEEINVFDVCVFPSLATRTIPISTYLRP